MRTVGDALRWPVNSCEFAATQDIKFIFAAWPRVVAIRRLNLPGIAIFAWTMIPPVRGIL
jgi:hypothetical protein